ncbi:MAG: glycogen/starch synthase [Lepagella sp.]
MQGNSRGFARELLIETSWEVCNKIGGIYTVLSSKAAELKKQFGDSLIFIGPDVWTAERPSPSFIERKTLLKSASSKMDLPDGLSIRVGRWDIPGSPVAILVKYDSLMPQMDAIFGHMWQDFGVDSLHAYGDYTASCAFAVAAAKVIVALTVYLKKDPARLIAHFDEWTTGMGLLYIKKHMPQAATVFTTHATSIGRSISSNGKPLYEYFTAYNGDQMARELNMEAKHSLEKRAACNADCFTTVSEVTSRECTQLLGVTPQVVTPNGFNSAVVPKGARYTADRRAARERILKVASALTGRDFGADTFVVATSGRNEYRNKGLDLYIDALAEVGQVNAVDRQVLALILVPAWVAGANEGLLRRLAGDEEANPWPHFSTHRLNNEDGDAVFLRLLRMQEKMQGSRVSFVYVPCYLDGRDGVLDMSYYKALTGVDATVFASYYEPWGYTPLESVAFGIPTVTTDKSGFGQWAVADFPDDVLRSGVKVVERTDTNYAEAADAIARTLEQICAYTPAQAKAAALAARATAAKASWSLFIKYYDEAYSLAMANAAKRNQSKK